MYTFDASPEEAEKTYKIVCEAYERFFDWLNIDTMKGIHVWLFITMVTPVKLMYVMYFWFTVVVADPGDIGGSLSHEYHVIAPVGEDTLIHCDR